MKELFAEEQHRNACLETTKRICCPADAADELFIASDESMCTQQKTGLRSITLQGSVQRF